MDLAGSEGPAVGSVPVGRSWGGTSEPDPEAGGARRAGPGAFPSAASDPRGRGDGVLGGGSSSRLLMRALGTHYGTCVEF